MRTSPPALEPAGRVWLGPGPRWGWLVGLGVLLLGTQAQSPAPTGDNSREDPPFRVGFSTSMFKGVNRNDVTASFSAWVQSVAEQRRVPVDPKPLLFDSLPTLGEALAGRRVDAVGMTTEEYARLRGVVQLAPVFVTRRAGRIGEEYVILVRRASGITGLGDLRGRRLMIYQHVRTCLAEVWLETLLARNQLPPPSAFFGHLTREGQLAAVVLPVFFGQSDACLATRSGYETMTELNPQVGTRLVTVASSPALLPALFSFRADYSAPSKARLLATLRELHRSPAGQQILTLFQSDRLEEGGPAELETACDLIRLHERLCGPGPAPARLSAAPPAAHSGTP